MDPLVIDYNLQRIRVIFDNIRLFETILMFSNLYTGRPRIWYQVLPVFFLFFFRW